MTERTRFEAQLQFSDRMASVGRLAAGVAHEINNPMTHVICSVELARAKLAQSGGSTADALLEADRMLSAAHGSALRVARIVADLQRISRNDGDRLAPMRVEDALEAAIAIAMSRIRGQCRLVRRYAAVTDIVANEGRLTQVFLNLLVNAAQALEQRDGEGEITVAIAPDGHGGVAVEIRDNGPGMDAEVLVHAFEAFYTTKPVGSGTGLGLSICYALVKALGGRIQLESAPGAGTTVRVELPAGDALAAAVVDASTAPPVAPDHGGTAVRPSAEARLRLLVIDDEPTILAIVEQSFQPHGDVTVERDPERALASLLAADPCPFDVILCDLLMPRMSGADLVERVRRERPALAERFVLMTGGVPSGAIQEFLDRCPNPVIRKPFTIPELIRVCRANVTG
ncbi:MAG: response regulator [Planctomycetes bacterium]|nr:response regulator [Planctomycetota bacterium]